jgi:hypothetical protein
MTKKVLIEEYKKNGMYNQIITAPMVNQDIPGAAGYFTSLQADGGNDVYKHKKILVKNMVDSFK